MDISELQGHIKEKDALSIQFSQEIDRMNLDILSHAKDFDTYTDLYCFAKKVASSQEEFNKAMLVGREMFLRAHP